MLFPKVLSELLNTYACRKVTGNRQGGFRAYLSWILQVKYYYFSLYVRSVITTLIVNGHIATIRCVLAYSTVAQSV